MKKEVSPEERLFNAIREGKNPPEAKKPKHQDIWRQMMEGLAGGPPETHTVDVPGSSINLKAINGILVLVLGVLVFWAGADILGRRPGVSELARSALAESGAVPVAASPQDFMPVENYTQEAEKRDIFHPIPPPKPRLPGPAAQVPQASQADLQAMIKDLNLSGIYQGDDTEVMIEDKAAKKNVFFKGGRPDQGA